MTFVLVADAAQTLPAVSRRRKHEAPQEVYPYEVWPEVRASGGHHLRWGVSQRRFQPHGRCLHILLEARECPSCRVT